jgi:hypothetical protein
MKDKIQEREEKITVKVGKRIKEETTLKKKDEDGERMRKI